jgi:mono/diheme cytochrome c family protein
VGVQYELLRFKVLSATTVRGVFALVATLFLSLGALMLPAAVNAQSGATFHKDIVPILQRSCQNCHRPDGVAPMSLVTYEETAPFAGLIEYKTGLRDRAGAMPPYYLEKDVGIQDYKDDPSLSDAEIAAISAWARSGAPAGDPADAPPALVFESGAVWTAGTPDLIVRTEDITVLGGAPDWWGDIPRAPIPLDEDRYVASVEIIEVNDVDTSGAAGTVGGRNIFHHMIWSTQVLDENLNALEDETPISWPVHEIARNPDIFDPDSGRLLKKGSYVVSDSVHLHSTGVDTTGHLLIGFRFHPVGYEPKYPPARLGLGNGVDISIAGNQDGQELHAYTVLQQHTKIVTFEPHLHAPGERMCLEAIWGYTVETLSCVGYDHNWVRGYTYADHAAPLLPEGTVLHIVGYMNNTASNPNVPDARNWQGSGNRSVTNMFIDLGMRVALTEEQFLEEMRVRRETLNLGPNDHQIGCPLCLAPLVAPLDPETVNADIAAEVASVQED